jgi:hypothetical protein
VILYLDTNIVSYLAITPRAPWTAIGVGNLKRRLIDEQRAGRLAFNGSAYHIEEASRISGARRRDFFRVFWDLVGPRLLTPTDDLVKEEARIGRPLTANEPYVTFRLCSDIRSWSLNASALDGLAEDVRNLVERVAMEQTERREAARAQLTALYAGKTVAEVTAAWWSDNEALIADWVLRNMQNSKEDLSLPHDEDLWPAPRQLQSAWAMTAYHLARIFLNVGLGRKISHGDTHDARHYASSHYGDVFVTDDRALKETHELIPAPKVQIVSFDAMASLVGVTPH